MEEELINNFKNDVNDLLSSLDKSLTLLEKNRKDKDVIGDVFRALHSLKNSASMFGFNIIGNFSHQLEDLCQEVIDESVDLTDEILNLFLESSDIIKKLLDDPNLENKTLRESYNQTLERIQLYFEENQETEEDDDEIFSNSKFQETFIEEASDLINQLEEQLLQLEGDINDKNLIDNIFRIMHTLKGNSNMFGYQHLGEITHHLENIYDDIRGDKLNTTKDILEITLMCIDHFRALLDDQELSVSQNAEQQEYLLGRIKNTSSVTNEVQVESQAAEKADEGGIKTYYLFFKPEINVFDDGTNPLYFIYDLNDLGECCIVSSLDEMPSDDAFKPELCYAFWHIIISTECSTDEINEHFLFLKEGSQPEVKLLSRTNLLKDKKFVDWFKKEAKQNIPLKDFKVTDAKTITREKETEPSHTQVKAQEQTISSIRVPSQKIDILMNLISELVTKQAELSMLASEAENAKLQEVTEGLEAISRDLRDNAFSISLIPLEKSVLRFQRLVRDVSAKFKKKVDFVVMGKETELDKTIIEKIIDPIMHILRNSIDHGIESPDVRKKLGKPEHGTITLKAFPSGANVVIQILDDGAGINLEKVKSHAIRKGYISENEQPSKDDLLKLILTAGFSTADNVSEVSGRGVGMDVVNQKINEIRGELEIYTEKDKGTEMTIKLPLTVSIIDSLLVTISGDYYIIPLDSIERCAEVNSDVIINAKNNHIVLDGEYLPVLDLRNEFVINTERPGIQRIVIVSYRDTQVALVVDTIIGNYQAVLKSLSAFYREQDMVSGASILGSGEVALVLDTNRLIMKYAEQIKEGVDKQKMEIV